MAELYSNSIFWIDVEKIKPNPFQPRRDFDQQKLSDLADSVRQYGVLQPLVVSRIEVEKDDGLSVTYELIAGERRLRAARQAGLKEVPVIIRVGDDAMAKLELAIIENLQREDLNAVDRARAFKRLTDEFKFTHLQVAQKVGKSREYVSNTMRLLSLSEDVLNALSQGQISEGHTRPILMLSNHPEQQLTLFKEIVFKKITVREAESIARKIAFERIRKKEYVPDPELIELENKLGQVLGTRVQIERRDFGGHLKIDFFSADDLRTILDLLKSNQIKSPSQVSEGDTPLEALELLTGQVPTAVSLEITQSIDSLPLDDRSKDEIKKDEEDLYNIQNFSI